jgi:hypothetical protein
MEGGTTNAQASGGGRDGELMYRASKAGSGDEDNRIANNQMVNIKENMFLNRNTRTLKLGRNRRARSHRRWWRGETLVAQQGLEHHRVRAPLLLVRALSLDRVLEKLLVLELALP